MFQLQRKIVRGIDGNWEHIQEKHHLSEEEVISVFKSGPLQSRKNKMSHAAEYMVGGRTFSGKWIKICYSWDDEKRNWIWVHTAF